MATGWVGGARVPWAEGDLADSPPQCGRWASAISSSQSTDRQIVSPETGAQRRWSSSRRRGPLRTRRRWIAVRGQDRHRRAEPRWSLTLARKSRTLNELVVVETRSCPDHRERLPPVGQPALPSRVGRSDADGPRPASSSEHDSETGLGPVRGIWAMGVIAVHPERGWPLISVEIVVEVIIL